MNTILNRALPVLLVSGILMAPHSGALAMRFSLYPAAAFAQEVPASPSFLPKSASLSFGSVLERASEKLRVFFGIDAQRPIPPPPSITPSRATNQGNIKLARVNSCSALERTLRSAQSVGGRGAVDFMLPSAPSQAFLESGKGDMPAYSQTNIQVAGVDEADIVKTDGTYIYAAGGSRITISRAYPQQEAALLSVIPIENGEAIELFARGNTLVIFGRKYASMPFPLPGLDRPAEERTPGMPNVLPLPYYPQLNLTFIQLYDISNRTAPRLIREAEIEGDYKTSRLIGGYAYAVLTSFPRLYPFDYEPAAAAQNPVPLFRDSVRTIQSRNGFAPLVPCNAISYFSPLTAPQYLTIVSISLENPRKELAKKVVLGAGENVYVSEKNLYVAATDYGYAVPMFGGAARPAMQRTSIYKFSLDRGAIREAGNGEAPGRTLNQFSMDEFDGYLRIATTIEGGWGGGFGPAVREQHSTNNVYIFDKNLRRVSSLEGLAPGERIYAARFMGKKAFLVTFKKVDPLFALDLSNPRSPRVVGQLKIPGYSDYLHPYDENHLIGIGKEAIEAESGDFAWYQGMKIALFDITDAAQPRQIANVSVGDRGTDSPILRDHRAFLFDRERHLLVIPVLLAEIPPAEKRAGVPPAWAPPSGTFTFQGAYVYDIRPETGIALRGRITHVPNNDPFLKSGSYFNDGESSIARSLFIGDSLYTVSRNTIAIHSLKDLKEQNVVSLVRP